MNILEITNKYYMILKSTYHIFNNPWKEDIPNIESFPIPLPPSEERKNLRDITIDDVKLWEQIYYEPGVIGLYASWDPFEEFYLLTYNFLLDQNNSYKTFYGINSVDNIISELKLLDINLKVTKIKTT
jgi:hypothetical protein